MQLKKYYIWLLSILSGLLMGMAWPVNGVVGLVFIAWIPLLFVRDFVRNNPEQFSRGAMVLYSYVTFLIFNLYTTWWVAYSSIEGGLMAFLLNSLFMSLVFGLAHIIDKKVFNKRAGFFVLIFFWLSYEYLHMNWELSWSWLNLGNVFSENPNWVQWYSITGTLGGTVWVLALNLVLFSTIKKFIRSDKNIIAVIPNIIVAVAVFVTPLLFSNSLLKEDLPKDLPTVNLLLVQPNVEPYYEAYELNSNQLVHNMLSVVREYMDDSTELVITPESTIERSMWEHKMQRYSAIDSIIKFVGKNPQLDVLMGVSTRRAVGENEEVKAYARSFIKGKKELFYYKYNTALFISDNQPLQFYHKSKLVPGVERLPFAAYLKPIQKFAIDLGGTTGSLGTSDEPKTFDFGNNRRVSPIICYESIYGELVGKFSSYGGGFIAIITNDAWWYESPGYRQHFSIARLRAVENNQYVVRAANTGITGVIDNKGNIVSVSEFYTKTAIKAKIPLNNTPTYYAVNGNYLARFSLFMVGLMLVIAFSKKLRKE